jgi:hypothetical protein
MVWPPQSARIITSVGLGVIAWRRWRTGAVVDRALDEVRVSAGVTAWTRRLPPG